MVYEEAPFIQAAITRDGGVSGDVVLDTVGLLTTLAEEPALEATDVVHENKPQNLGTLGPKRVHDDA